MKIFSRALNDTCMLLYGTSFAMDIKLSEMGINNKVNDWK